MAKFINDSRPIKIRVGNSQKCYWKTIKTGDIVEISPTAGKRLGFIEITDSHQESPRVTEGQIGNKKVETKQTDFFEELVKIKGIGVKTAEDIIRIFPKREGLKNTINKKEQLPFRDDICELLEAKYG